MALGDAFITSEALASYLDELDLTVTDPDRDENLLSAVNAASEDVRKVAGRDFNKADTATTRLYIPNAPGLVKTDDIYTTDGLVIQVLANGYPQGAPLTSDEYELFPMNGYADGEAQPYTGFRIPWPFFRPIWLFERVQVTAKWGWAQIPGNIIQATKIRAAELYKLRDAPLGAVTVGSGSANYTLKARPTQWEKLACSRARSEKRLYLG